MFSFQQGEGSVPVHEGGRKPVGGGHTQAAAGCGSTGGGQDPTQVLDDRAQCPV